MNLPPGLPPNARILYSSAAIAERIAELGQQINLDYAGKSVVLIGVLKGSFMFLADLVRHLDLSVRIEFMGTRSYEGSSSSGEVQLTKDLDKPVAGEHVLLVEDIIDTGLTLQYLLAQLHGRQPASLKTVAFLDKPSRRRAGLESLHGDYIGFTIPNHFVIGYGLDYDQRFRHLKDLWILGS
jgi:hypoxanthine phosphoribosyltransferase